MSSAQSFLEHSDTLARAEMQFHLHKVVTGHRTHPAEKGLSRGHCFLSHNTVKRKDELTSAPISLQAICITFMGTIHQHRSVSAPIRIPSVSRQADTMWRIRSVFNTGLYFFQEQRKIHSTKCFVSRPCEEVMRCIARKKKYGGLKKKRKRHMVN